MASPRRRQRCLSRPKPQPLFDQVEEAPQRVAAGVPLSRVAREAGVSRSLMSGAMKRPGPYATPSGVA